jgi:hypothetical protein
MLYTDCHDLSAKYLVKELIRSQRQDLARLSECAALLRDDPAASALGDEIVGNAQGHLENLQSLQSTSKPIIPTFHEMLAGTAVQP